MRITIAWICPHCGQSNDHIADTGEYAHGTETFTCDPDRGGCDGDALVRIELVPRVQVHAVTATADSIMNGDEVEQPSIAAARREKAKGKQSKSA